MKNQEHAQTRSWFFFLTLFAAHLALLLFDHAFEDVPHTKQKL